MNAERRDVKSDLDCVRRLHGAGHYTAAEPVMSARQGRQRAVPDAHACAEASRSAQARSTKTTGAGGFAGNFAIRVSAELLLFWSA